MTRQRDEVEYTEFEQGERQALIEVRGFIIKHGTREVDAYAAQRLHDISMDARHVARHRQAVRAFLKDQANVD